MVTRPFDYHDERGYGPVRLLVIYRKFSRSPNKRIQRDLSVGIVHSFYVRGRFVLGMQRLAHIEARDSGDTEETGCGTGESCGLLRGPGVAL